MLQEMIRECRHTSGVDEHYGHSAVDDQRLETYYMRLLRINPIIPLYNATTFVFPSKITVA